MDALNNTHSPTLLMLPGLDGSGILFKPLIDLLPLTIRTKIAVIPTILLSGHKQIAKQILADLPDGKYVILAESFSGRTAYELCRMAPDKFSYVVFIASFVNRPSHLLRFALLLPITRIVKSKLIMQLMAKCLFGSNNTKALLSALNQAISTLPNACINNRLSILNRLKQPSIRLDVPCFIVTAKQDLLLNRTAQSSIKKVFNHHAEQQLEGPHFLLQTRARHCAKIITTLYVGLADVRSPVVPITIDPTIAL